MIGGKILDGLKRSIIDLTNNVSAIRVALVPTAPTITSVSPDDQKNTITWSAVGGATDYIIYWDTSSGVTKDSNEIITGSTSTSYEHAGLTNGTAYFYRVLAVGAWGNTDLGNEESGTPIAYLNQTSTLFDGIDEFVTFGDNHNFEQNEAFTLSAWVKVTNLAGSRKTIWAKASNDASVNGWGWYIETNGDFFFQARTSTINRQATISGTGISAGTFYHMVVTYDGSSNMDGLTFYVDGSSVGSPSSASLSGTILVSEDSQIARRNTAFPMNANIDEVTWWDKELSASEVSELYNAGSPDNPENHSASANLIHWYKAGDGDTFPTWSDSVGVVDGTMTNMESGDFVADVP